MPLSELVASGMHSPFNFSRIFRFGLCGMAGMGLDFAVTWLCRVKLKWNKYAANAAGFSVAVVNNYLLNRLWTFGSTSTSILSQFTSFMLISLCGLLANTLLLAFFHQRLKLNFYLSKLFAIGLVFCWNYLGSSLFTFSL